MRKLSKVPLVRSFGGLVVALLFAACASLTPAGRIQENPSLYQSLPPEQQALVCQGKISVGMSPQAVYLAWGYPNSVPYEGEKDGKKIIRWVYNIMEPVLVNDSWCGPYAGPCAWGDPFAPGPSTAYVPCNAATVVFENGKVVSWESRIPQP